MQIFRVTTHDPSAIVEITEVFRRPTTAAGAEDGNCDADGVHPPPDGTYPAFTSAIFLRTDATRRGGGSGRDVMHRLTAWGLAAAVLAALGGAAHAADPAEGRPPANSDSGFRRWNGIPAERAKP